MLTKNSIKRPYTVIVMLVVIAIIGGVAVTQMPLDLFPEMELPYMIVATMVPGASPEEVEKSVTSTMEESMRQINNVKDVQSISAESVSAVIMALQNGTDLTTMTQDIDTNIKAIKSTFPAMAMEPIIMKVDPDMMPVMTLTISKYGQTIEQSSDTLRDISDKIKSVGGVASVTTTGDIEDKVFMQVKPEKILEDPMNLLVNHLCAYVNNPLKAMPEKLINMTTPGNPAYNSNVESIINLLKTDDAENIIFLIESFINSNMPGFSLDITGLLGDNKDEFLATFSQMLTPEMISMMITGNNFEMPAGTTPVKGVDFIIKVGQKLETFNRLKHLPAFSLDLREMKLVDPSVDKKSDEYKNAPTVIEMIEPMLKMLIPASTTGDMMTAKLTGIVNNMMPTATPEEKASIVNTMKSMLLSMFYNTNDNVNYARDNDMFDYFMGILRQPLTVELQDFAYMYKTNTAASAHTLVNGADGMMLSVFKTPDASVTSVTNGITKLMKDIQANDDTIECIVLSNQGEVTKFMISSIAQNLLLGALFAIVVLLIFLRDWKPTVTVGMSIIVSLVTAFAVMYLCGVTLNLVSMGGLALSVGMLVDNSIVVIENIYRKRNEGVSAIKAAYDGTKQVAGAIMSSTITTVIVFLPIIFVDGITKQIFTDLAITIAVSLFASLLVAITFVPMISSRMANLNKAARHETKAFVKFKAGYSKALNFMLDKKWITVTIVTVLFVASIISAFFMNVEFLPQTQMEQIIVSTGIDKSKITDDYAYDEIVDDVIKDINREFRAKPYVDNLGVELSGGMSVMGFTMGGGNIMSYVTLKKDAKIKPDDAIKELEETVDKISKNPKYPNKAVVLGGTKDASGVDIQKMVNNYLDASLLTVNVYGKDIDEMRNAALELEAIFNEKIGGHDETLDVDNGLISQSKEFKLVVDTKKASKYNLTTAQIFLQYFSATIPETSNSTINFTTDGEHDIYIYTAANNMERWYRAFEKNDDGTINFDKPHRMYFNKNDDTNGAKIFEERTKQKDGTIAITKYEMVSSNEMTEFRPKNGKVYAVPTNDMPVYTDNSKIKESDMITQEIIIPEFGEMPDMSDSGMMPMALEGQMGDLRQKDKLPIFMLLDPSSFAEKSVGVIDYRKASDERFKSMIDNKEYYEDANGYIRYNYSGQDVASINKNTDLNPRVPVGIKEVFGFNTISHVEGKRVVQMGLHSTALSNKVLEKEARAIINEYNKTAPGNISVEFVGANEVITETFNGLFMMIGMAVVFIYLVMVAQFQSLKSPFIIMFTIPLALTGSILTLLMAGMPISVFALTGIILLVGIVVNNGIVFVDYANKLREAGMPKREALIKTAQDRIRPILMTALTTICSMLISVFDTSMGAAAIKPMAVTVVGGLTYATLLTLFFVPILYDAFNRKDKLAVIKFDDDKDEDIEAEMRLGKISSVKEVIEESKTLAMMDEGFIANNLPTETPMESYINETTGTEAFKDELTASSDETEEASKDMADVEPVTEPSAVTETEPCEATDNGTETEPSVEKTDESQDENEDK